MHPSIDRTGREPARACARSPGGLTTLAFVAALGVTHAPAARAQDAAHTATIYVGSYGESGADRHGVFGADRHDAVIDSIAALAGLPMADGGATLPPDVVADASYYGDTPPPYYTPADVAELDSVTAAWGGGVPRYALVMAKYARDVMRRSGATRVNFVSASFGSLVTRWLIEKNVEGLAGEGRIARWLSIEGVLAGNWAASRTDLVHWLDFFDPQPIDVTHMSYGWVDTNLHAPRTEADDPDYAHILIGQMVSTDDHYNDDALSALMSSDGGYQPNDGVQAVADARFAVVTDRSRFEGLAPTLGYFHDNHFGIASDRGAWAQVVTFLTQRRRVTVTLTSAQVTDMHEPHAWYWDWRPAEVVLESRVYSPRMATRWGITDPVCTLEKDGAVAPLRRYNADGETQSVNQVLFDDFVAGDETRLRLVLRAEELDYDWRYGVFETAQVPYTDDLGGSELDVSTLAPGTYTFSAPSWNGTIAVALHDYPAAPSTDVPGRPAIPAVASLRVSPNPHGARVRISVAGLPASVGSLAGTLEVFDLTGRRVRAIPGDPRAGIDWDGRDQDGAALPAGLYFHRIVTPLGRWEGRSMLVRTGS